MKMRNVRIENCGTGISLNGGYTEIDGLTVINTPVAIELNGGAKINGKNITHRVGR